ncbi:hypothetical protein H0H92_004748 [Tricholoma furcatifolium]|nr:hypothetical protein H0H92_004748 [Tricholoma furcatifolium]
MLSSDYIIVGGGLTGTTLAVRLSEDPSISVTIIEAGGDVFHDDSYDTPAANLKNWGNPERDWIFMSSPQKNLDIAKLNGAPWSWDELLPYFRKSETFTYNEEEAKKYGMKFDERYQGTSGPVQRTIPRSVDDVVAPWIDAFKANGIKYNEDPAYYEPHRSRKNLNVITNAQATRVLTASQNGDIVATGVEFIKDGVLEVITASKEVILSCGSYKTPQLLELSGIGDETVLDRFGIPLVLNLPGVGNNLLKLNPGHETWESMADPAITKKHEEIYKTTGGGLLHSSLPTGAAFLTLQDLDEDGEIAKSINKLSLPNDPTFEIQKQWASNERVPFLEINLTDRFLPGTVAFPEPGATYFSSGLILLHPFHRGSVHIASKEPTASPEIDVNYLDNDADLKILVKAYRYFRKICGTEPLKSHIASEASPGAAIESDEDIIAYLRNTVSTTFHPIGTASMLPREVGGCVDTSLKVYGTSNLRVRLNEYSKLRSHIHHWPQTSLAQKMAQFFDLPSEVIFRILCFLDLSELVSLSHTNSSLRAAVVNSPGLQFRFLAHDAAVKINQSSNHVASERLSALRRLEGGWLNMSIDFQTKIPVLHYPSGLYDLSAGVCVLGDTDRQTLHYCKLPSRETDAVEWKQIKVGCVMVDFGLSVYEHDLIAVLTL